MPQLTDVQHEEAMKRRFDNLYAAYDRIQENFRLGPAQQAAAKAIEDGTSVVEAWRNATPITGPISLLAKLERQVWDLRQLAEKIAGDPESPLTRAWSDVRPAITAVYISIWVLQDTFRTDYEGVKHALTDELGDTLGKAAEGLGKGLQATFKAAINLFPWWIYALVALLLVTLVIMRLKG